MDRVKKILRWFVPSVQYAEDGREKWPSRLSFILASMGLAVGIGNLLRYPSIVFRNNGLQWFIPYLMALFLIGIPLLLLEICIGQAYRGGAVVAFNRVSHRLRGLGLSVIYIAYIITTYYVIILAWGMVFFRNSFINPLPWKGGEDEAGNFFFKEVVRNKKSVPGNNGFLEYPNVSVIGETLGWTMLIWLLVYLSIFKGVSLTGRIVYFSMLFPLFMLIVITIRGVTLDNAWRGIRLYIGSWSSEKLRGGQIWRDAVGQIFFSIGTGFGSFIAYASYNNKYAHAVQDSIIIALSNSFYEVLAGFAAFGVIGYLDINEKAEYNTFVIAFITYPQALATLPGGNVWSVFFFLTVILLGIDSAFGLLESSVTVVTDTDWGKKLPRWLVIAIMTICAALLSIMYTTEFGFDLLDAVDTWFNHIALILSMWVQCISVTSLYRYKDIVSQVGFTAYIAANTVYITSMLLLVILGHHTEVWIGIVVFFVLLIGGTLLTTFLAQTPEIPGPFGNSAFLHKLWWLTSYSGHQLAKDLNVIVAQGRQWKIPVLWAPLLRWFTAPVLMVVLSFSYEDFWAANDAVPKTKNPLHIFAFILAHLVVIALSVGLILPQALSVFIPAEKKMDSELQYSKLPRETLDDDRTLPLNEISPVTSPDDTMKEETVEN